MKALALPPIGKGNSMMTVKNARKSLIQKKITVFWPVPLL
jgi:hypothetical protein